MSETVKDSVSEVLAGPATLLVYVVTFVGLALAIATGQDSTSFEAYLELVDQLEVPLGILIGGRATLVAADSIGKAGVKKAAAAKASPAKAGQIAEGE